MRWTHHVCDTWAGHDNLLSIPESFAMHAGTPSGSLRSIPEVPGSHLTLRPNLPSLLSHDWYLRKTKKGGSWYGTWTRNRSIEFCFALVLGYYKYTSHSFEDLSLYKLENTLTLIEHITTKVGTVVLATSTIGAHRGVQVKLSQGTLCLFNHYIADHPNERGALALMLTKMEKLRRQNEVLQATV